MVEAVERGGGELRAVADIEALVDMILGAAWYRHLLEHAPLDERYAQQIAATIVEGNWAPFVAKDGRNGPS